MRGIYVRDHGIAWDGIVPIADGFVTVCDVREGKGREGSEGARTWRRQEGRRDWWLGKGSIFE